MKNLMGKLEELLEIGGTKKDITLLVISGSAIVLSLLGISPFPFDMAWIAIVLCGLPIILEAIIGLVTAFDIKADVLVSLALIASVVHWRGFCGRRSGIYYAAWWSSGRSYRSKSTEPELKSWFI